MRCACTCTHVFILCPRRLEPSCSTIRYFTLGRSRTISTYQPLKQKVISTRITFKFVFVPWWSKTNQFFDHYVLQIWTVSYRRPIFPAMRFPRTSDYLKLLRRRCDISDVILSLSKKKFVFVVSFQNFVNSSLSPFRAHAASMLMERFSLPFACFVLEIAGQFVSNAIYG